MGQKTHPVGFRLGIIKTWDAKWFGARDYPELLREDLMVRRYTKQRLSRAGAARVGIVSRIGIERASKKITINIHTPKPGIVIGRRGSEVDQLRDELQLLTKKEVYVNILEVKRPELDAQLVADHIAHQLEQRVAFRRAMKKAVASAMRMGAQGIRICCSGRLGGAEMARREWYRDGRVPLHTLRADIDFARSTGHTTYGCIGVKVWIFKGEVFKSTAAEPAQQQRGRPVAQHRG